MNVKRRWILIGILAAVLTLSCTLLLHNPSNKARKTEKALPETGCLDSSNENAQENRPVIIPAKRLPTESRTEDALDCKPHIPRELESWLQGLRRQLLEKVEAQMHRNAREYQEQRPAGKKEHPIGRNSPAKAEQTDPADSPFLLWRELQLRGDNSLVVNMLLVNNRREGQSRGVIVSQIIPEGWSLSAAWPDIQACNPGRREVKWLFAEAASRENWILQVVLTPEEQAEIPLLPEENTIVRCCMPGGNLMQYPCISLP